MLSERYGLRADIYWILSSIVGGVTLALLIIWYSTTPGSILFWSAFILPGIIIGIIQRRILLRYYALQASLLWITGSIVSSVSFIAVIFLITDGIPAFILVFGVFGMVAGFIQAQSLQDQPCYWERWMALSGACHALGGPLGYLLGTSYQPFPFQEVSMITAISILTDISIRGLIFLR